MEEGRLPGLQGRQCSPGDTPQVLITRAGRTRGITGAIGLMLAGFGGSVAALENGTQGGALSDRELERNNRPDPFPELDAAGLATSAKRGHAD